MKLSIIGTGYVGLVAAAAFADFGNDVICADIDQEKIAALRRGEIPIYEPGLDTLVRRNLDAGRLRFTTDNAEAAAHGDVIFMAVGTPTRAADGSADLSYLMQAAIAVAEGLQRPAIIVNKSTVPVGTSERVARVMGERTSQPLTVASNPEFLKEGSAVADFMRPDRVIIGTADERAREVLRRLYQPFCRTNDRLIFMDPRAAELTKYACNAYLATRISFINDIANLADAVGADVEQIRQGMGSDPRIGNKFLFPGAGYGGSCFPKDTRALLNTAREYGVALDLVAAADRLNEGQKLVMVRKVRQHFTAAALATKRLAIWGLAFKPNTDDVREAPALRIVDTLVGDGATIQVYDPVAGPNFMAALGGTQGAVTLAESPYAAAEGADALLLVTEWREFRSPDFERLKRIMAAPVLFDGRNQWDRQHVETLGFTYTGIGR